MDAILLILDLWLYIHGKHFSKLYIFYKKLCLLFSIENKPKPIYVVDFTTGKFVPIYRLVNIKYPKILLSCQNNGYFQFSPPPCAHLFMTDKKITYVIVKEGIVDIC